MKTQLCLKIMINSIIIVLLAFLTEAVPEPREAYLDGTGYMRLHSPLTLWSHAALSFRSCTGGELFKQTFKGDSFQCTISRDSIVLSLTQQGVLKREVEVNTKLLDNDWHIIQFIYRLGNLTLYMDNEELLIANSTYNTEYLAASNIKDEAAILILGDKFSGCVLSGPGFQFDNRSLQNAVNVKFGPCPLSTDPCVDSRNVLRVSQENHCFNEPCMQHGICTSKANSYECHCSDRYSGKNCQQDQGPLCLVEKDKPPKCENGGTCTEDAQGYLHCLCAPGYTGFRCENEVIIHPLCIENPCINGGSCQADSGEENYFCECKKGYNGRNCEINIDDCKSQPCLHGGTCIDHIDNFTCECEGTGFTGHICDVNIDECETLWPCLHGATCFDFYGTYICTCASGYGGLNCEQHLDECLSSPCHNGGTCVNKDGSYVCQCMPGDVGPFCEKRIPCSNVVKCPPDSDCEFGECYCKPGTNGMPGQCIISCADGLSGYSCNTSMSLSEPCKLKICSNEGTCNPSTGFCECRNGFGGDSCEYRTEICNPLCSELQVCVGGKCCLEGKDCQIDPCHSSPCMHEGNCTADNTGSINYSCRCKEGWTGTQCEVDINECEVTKNLCNNGICQNREGSFQCYCEPGYTGKRCEMDVDECLSSPCKNMANCINKVNDYACECLSGYTGKQCESDIDECESNPCVGDSTCVDKLASYECQCSPGMAGMNCEVDIDECQSMPCLHDGQCKDGRNSFTCNCDGTGYTGLLCDTNIDECASNPCQNDAECQDEINDYQCICLPGYTGKNCEEDINECESSPCLFGGTCLERSNHTLYEMYKSSAIPLPIVFSGTFSHANASGYECVCQAGTTGKKCEKNINECDSNPCGFHGSCNDKVGRYECDCADGFEGVHCEIDIDECDRFKPCEHGQCKDDIASYYCHCERSWGGRNCSVKLTGCDSSPCLYNGTCLPYVINETEHKFNCSCVTGFQGATCDKVTTMSHGGNNSYVEVNTTRDEGYDIQLRFKTTLPNGLLALGSGLTYYILELVNGRLNLHSSLLNKWEGVSIGANLNNSKWQKIFVAINSTHLVLSANEEQTIYPINTNDVTNASFTSFPTTHLGGAIEEFSSLIHGPPYFVGCTEDVVINGEWVLPDKSGAITKMVNVHEGCPRTNQCQPNPCHSGGHCSDLWSNFSCSCERPYLGITCQYNRTAATFGHENTTNSLVVVNVSEVARKAVRTCVDISMFIRTRQDSGQLFHLGSPIVNGTISAEDSYVAALLSSGDLLLKIQFNGSPEAYTVSGSKLDNGYNHLIEVVRNLTLIQVKINGTEYFRKTISSTGPLDAQLLYLGGKPQPIPETRPARQAIVDLKEGLSDFKGIIQDVQINNGSGTMIVEFFPLDFPGLPYYLPFGTVIFNNSSILEGIVSDDLCKSSPCRHNASCNNTWNDFICTCPIGYKGKFCQDIEFCQIRSCPNGSMCHNLDDGYECVSNITFNGNNETLRFRPASTEDLTTAPDRIEIQYRSKTGGTMLHIRNGEMYFEVAVYKDQITLQFRLSEDETFPVSYRFHKENSDYGWARVLITITSGKIEADFEPWSFDHALIEQINQSGFENLFNENMTIVLGGAINDDIIFDGLNYNAQKLKNNNLLTTLQNDNSTYYEHDFNLKNVRNGVNGIENGAMFKGCLGEVRLGNNLLAFYSRQEIYPDNWHGVTHYELIGNRTIDKGCVLCFEQDCFNGGECLNSTEFYNCKCQPGYEEDDCSKNIDECIFNECEHNSTCIDGIAGYTCDCQKGYEGQFCKTKKDECESSPCLNGGTCENHLAYYECHCLSDFAGPQCETSRLITCENNPCKNGSSCIDGHNDVTGNNFTCECSKGFTGAMCDKPYCSVVQCQNGGTCQTTENGTPTCACLPGFEDDFCETNIDDCKSHPCLNGGICIDGIDSFTCSCSRTGFKGATCNRDIDECVERNIDCGGEGICNNTLGSYHCMCFNDKCGFNCHLEDPCSVNPCANEGICVEKCDTTPEYECICKEGFGAKNCTEEISLGGASPVDIAIIVVPIVIGILGLGGALIGALLVMARNKRATRGTYSPSAQEYCNPRLEMDSVLKPPPEERLI